MLAPLLLSALVASFVAAAPDVTPTSSTPEFVSGNGTKFITAAWVAGWLVDDAALSKINWQSYSLLTWSFAKTTPDPGNLDFTGSGPEYIPKFVDQAKAHNVMASVSVGGWTGSQYFSSAVTPANRTKFVDAIIAMVDTYKLDGVDFDWEYPNTTGIGCNEVSGSDSENYLGFLQALRAKLADRKLYLTAAVSPAPFIGMPDVSGFAGVLDHITIMNYDINGQWGDTVGPNAPLDSCSTPKTGSATDAVKAWTDAGFPANKITLGVPSYGHSFNVPSSSAIVSGNLVINPPFNKNGPSDPPEKDQCGNTVAKSDSVTFAAMIAKNLLNTDGTPASGMEHKFDDCSQTPFLYDGTNQMMYSYDDRESFAAKGRFINQHGLLGASMWDLSGDPNGILLESLTAAAGVTDDC